MKSALAVVVLLITGSLTSGCVADIDPGFVGVVATKAGYRTGRLQEVVGPTWEWYGPTASVYTLPSRTQRVAWTETPTEGETVDQAIRVNSSDQLPFVMDVGVSYHVSTTRGCPSAVVMYQPSIDVITAGVLRDLTREHLQNAVGRRLGTVAYTSGREAIQREAVAGIQGSFNRLASVPDSSAEGGRRGCFVIDGLSIQRMTPPASVVTAMEARAQATQQAQEARARLEQVRYTSQADSIRAATDANNNRLLAESISPQLIQYEIARGLAEGYRTGRIQPPRVVSGGGGMGMIIDPSVIGGQ
ncbi:MAG TPA: SPFH domain-containing protein [Rubricoccaceae bacterium]|jgi:regulator of protease activity HflC (stomatin/prohibitin superfamily)